MKTSSRRLALVGAGHAHLEVLREAARQRFDAELVVVSPSSQQIYSGMMPGQLSGAWSESALTVDVPALCRAAGARFVESAVAHIDAQAAAVSISCANGERIDGTHASCDIGAVPIGLDLPGVREFAHRTRPLDAWRALVGRATREPAPSHCCVIGAGAAGVELAFALARRSRRSASTTHVTVLSSSPLVPAGMGVTVASRVRALLDARGIQVETSAHVRAVTASAVQLENGSTMASDFTVWTTGADASSLFRESALPVDRAGFLSVDDTLRATTGVPVWGAGDCISMASAPWMTKSGVYAVRAAPILAHNLRVACSGAATSPVRAFVPQRHTMFILDTADGRALLCRRSLAVHSRWALSLKRWIDQRFVARYAVD